MPDSAFLHGTRYFQEQAPDVALDRADTLVRSRDQCSRGHLQGVYRNSGDYTARTGFGIHQVLLSRGWNGHRQRIGTRGYQLNRNRKAQCTKRSRRESIELCETRASVKSFWVFRLTSVPIAHVYRRHESVHMALRGNTEDCLSMEFEMLRPEQTRERMKRWRAKTRCRDELISISKVDGYHDCDEYQCSSAPDGESPAAPS